MITNGTATNTTVWARFDRLTGALLMLLAIVAVVVSILVTSAAREALLVAAILAAGLATAAIHILAVYALAERRAWARPVHGTLTVDVGHVHAARWIVWSDPVSCSVGQRANSGMLPTLAGALGLRHASDRSVLAAVSAHPAASWCPPERLENRPAKVAL